MSMIKSYFFVPANKESFIKKSLVLKGIYCRVLDFEDSISDSEIDKAVNLVQKNEVLPSDWARIKLSNDFESLSQKLIQLGIRNLILPKLKDFTHANDVIKTLLKINSNIRFIILIENAMIYLQLNDILSKWHTFIDGIALGSHDFSAATKISHTINSLYSIRLQLSLIASAFNLTSIDIASMNISDEKAFNDEIKTAYDLGYRAKFILHPFQLKVIDEFPFFSKSEIKEAQDVLEKFEDNATKNSEVVIKHNGKIYETPHLENLKEKIIWGKKYYGTDR